MKRRDFRQASLYSNDCGILVKSCARMELNGYLMLMDDALIGKIICGENEVRAGKRRRTIWSSWADMNWILRSRLMDV